MTDDPHSPRSPLVTQPAIAPMFHVKPSESSRKSNWIDDIDRKKRTLIELFLYWRKGENLKGNTVIVEFGNPLHAEEFHKLLRGLRKNKG